MIRTGLTIYLDGTTICVDTDDGRGHTNNFRIDPDEAYDITITGDLIEARIEENPKAS